jgi:hypothetical protein
MIFQEIIDFTFPSNLLPNKRFIVKSLLEPNIIQFLPVK